MKIRAGRIAGNDHNVSALSLLRRETMLERGDIPAAISDPAVTGDGFMTGADEFLLEAGDGLRFHYRRNRGVRWDGLPRYDDAAIATFHHGSVWGAVAWLNGLIPLHASAIAYNGGVHAFAGISGVGKSTLVAALAAKRWSLFADDVVTVDVAPGLAPFALPGHKRLKLWADALALTGWTEGERVWPGLDKYYVDVGGLDHPIPLPLASLTLIEDAADDEPSTIVPVCGAARLSAFNAHCYRAEMRLPSRAAPVFAQLAVLAAKVPVFRMRRPRRVTRFRESVDTAVRHLEALTA